MEDKPKINFQKNRLPKFKRWYMVKILFYIIILIGVMAYLYYAATQASKPQPREEIEGVEISL